MKRERQGEGCDERVVLATLTAQGIEQIEAWQQKHREMLSHMLSPLTQKEQDELQRLIERVLEFNKQTTTHLTNHAAGENKIVNE